MTGKNKFEILVVDDTPEVLEMTIHALKKAQYKVTGVSSGEECLQQISKNKPDILLLDVMLPDILGTEITRIIKQNPALASIFIILLSSLKTSTDAVANGLEEGADGYITRPVNNRELIARIDAACRLVEAERKITKATKKYELLFSAMKESVLFIEPVKNEANEFIDFKITDANPSARTLLNIKDTHITGKFVSEIFGDTIQSMNEILIGLTKSSNCNSTEFYNNALQKYFTITLYPSDSMHFALSILDISDRKHAEELINQKNEILNNAVAEKDKFFSIIAHDLKSPFNSILGFSELLSEVIEEKNYEQVKAYSDIINKSSKRAMELLQNLMEWAQAKTGRISFNPMVLKLRPLVDDIIELYSDIANQKHIKVTAGIDSNLVIFADKSMINTVLRNLISNALKFTYPNGAINILGKENIENVQISVTDTGVGIDKIQIDKMFRLGESITTYGTKDEKGTGLGLILCKEFIEKHGGEIWIESEPEVGSTFYFNIPKI